MEEAKEGPSGPGHGGEAGNQGRKEWRASDGKRAPLVPVALPVTKRGSALLGRRRLEDPLKANLLIDRDGFKVPRPKPRIDKFQALRERYDPAKRRERKAAEKEERRGEEACRGAIVTKLRQLGAKKLLAG